MPASSSGVSLAELEAAIGYRFRDRRLPLEALTHRTYSHEHPGTAPDFNERLEFLGDAVLGLVVSEALFRRFPRGDEGMLSRMKAAVVRDRQLALTAGEIGLGRFVRLGRGEEKTGGRTKPSLMADAMEALFAAVYLDGKKLGFTPLVQKGVAVGRHQVEVRAYGARQSRQVEIKPRTTVKLRFQLTGGKLAVNAVPWAEIYFDGKKLGTTPLAIENLPLGPHRLELRRQGYGTVVREVVLEEGKAVRLKVRLTAEP